MIKWIFLPLHLYTLSHFQFHLLTQAQNEELYYRLPRGEPDSCTKVLILVLENLTSAELEDAYGK